MDSITLGCIREGFVTGNEQALCLGLSRLSGGEYHALYDVVDSFVEQRRPLSHLVLCTMLDAAVKTAENLGPCPEVCEDHGEFLSTHGHCMLRLMNSNLIQIAWANSANQEVLNRLELVYFQLICYGTQTFDTTAGCAYEDMLSQLILNDNRSFDIVQGFGVTVDSLQRLSYQVQKYPSLVPILDYFVARIRTNTQDLNHYQFMVMRSSWVVMKQLQNHPVFARLVS
jgi:hypothetical protein